MSDETKVLIVCTGNSARSILGEALINAQAGFKGFSAGSTPKGVPHPMALTVLAAKGHDISSFSSKSWDDFSGADADEMDIIITVCDSAANEVCPVWPGHPVQAHWGLPDPAYIEDQAECRAAFEAVYERLSASVVKLAVLDLDGLGARDKSAAVQAIAP